VLNSRRFPPLAQSRNFNPPYPSNQGNRFGLI